MFERPRELLVRKGHRRPTYCSNISYEQGDGTAHDKTVPRLALAVHRFVGGFQKSDKLRKEGQPDKVSLHLVYPLQSHCMVEAEIKLEIAV